MYLSFGHQMFAGEENIWHFSSMLVLSHITKVCAITCVKNLVAYFFSYSYIKKQLQEETKLPLAERSVNIE